jgi:hypothetical protein
MEQAAPIHVSPGNLASTTITAQLILIRHPGSHTLHPWLR